MKEERVGNNNISKNIHSEIIPSISWRKFFVVSILAFKNPEVRCSLIFKGKIMKIEKALINDRLRVLKVSWKFHIATSYGFTVIYPWNLLFS